MRIILKIFSRNFLIRISYYLVPILRIIYSGNNFIDPIDGRGYSKFLSYGYGKLRKNALSPGTLSLERHRLLWLYLNRRTNLLNSKLKVLHIAPEQIFYKKFKNNMKWDYTTFDLKSPLADIKGDVTNLTFEDNTFDLIICNHVLEHIIDDRTAMKEIYRVLKKDGIGILQVPIDKSLEKTYEDNTLVSKRQRAKNFGQYDHVRKYGIDYKDRLENTGFSVNLIDYTNEFEDNLISKYGLIKGELIPIVKKSIA
ncbi:MAG: methyltransferase domain-containing protein [Bacteroidota bacterium]|mgnify:CR=1 FL=1|nr:methyltransferase domain-containing protein [Bacteroidota bacterium]|tara:strand:+ start:474 stop:1235 length:762 start_codon:yes stop_codon:yes gene_type:complete